MDHLLTSAGVAAAALFPVMDPIGIVPWFAGATRALSRPERIEQARKALFASVLLLVTFLLVGRYLLEFFGISLAAIEFVGGLVLGYVGWTMTIGSSEASTADDDQLAAEAAREIYFTPLTFPLLAGPGAIAVAFGLSNRYDNWLDFPGFALGAIAASLACFAIMANADRILSRIGPRGIDMLERLAGLLILAIAAELVFHGISDHFGLESFE